jgi:hypothetical protein
MGDEQPTPTAGFAEPPEGSFRELMKDAVRYWEVRRVIYNAALFAVCVVWVVATWPHFRPAFSWWAVPPMAFLTLVANVCYSAAYLVDIPMQQSSMGKLWRNRRWGLWVAGTVFAIVLANYWIADEIYPDVH